METNLGFGFSGREKGGKPGSNCLLLFQDTTAAVEYQIESFDADDFEQKAPAPLMT